MSTWTLTRIPRRGRTFAAVLSAAAFSLLLAQPALAAFHLMVIQEVFLGTPSDGILHQPPLTPDQRAQYVMLRMTSGGQTFVAGASLRVEDKDGNLLGTFGTFSANVANGGGACSYPACPAVIIGTQAAKNLFSFTFDKIVDGQAGRVALPRDGGRVCFVSGSSLVDCVAWGTFNCRNSGNCSDSNTERTGDFSANACDTDFGTPAPAPHSGQTVGHTGGFDCLNKDNATNYALSFPHPVNNAGANNNADADADGLIDALDCNDASGTILWPATEVQNDHIAGKPLSTLTWDSQSASAGSGVTYDVVRGTLAALNGFSNAVCHAPNLSAATTTDGTVPAAGTGLYFVERAGSGAGCVGTYGSGFAPATSRDTFIAATCP